SRLGHANPFLPERIEWERMVLGADFVAADPVWTVRPDRQVQNPNVARLAERAEPLARTLRDRIAARTRASDQELVLYEAVVLYLLYARHEARLLELVLAPGEADAAGGWEAFQADRTHFCELPELRLPTAHDPAHLFACMFQVRRAFHHTFWHLIGGSMS